MMLLNEQLARKVDHRCDDVISWRIQFLNQDDRDLMDAVMLRGVSITVISRMCGVDPQVLRRRVRRLLKRIRSREFVEVIRSLAYLEPADQRVGRMKYCWGYSYRKLCAELSITMHQLRRRLDKLDASIKVINRISSGIKPDEKIWS